MLCDGFEVGVNDDSQDLDDWKDLDDSLDWFDDEEDSVADLRLCLPLTWFKCTWSFE